MTALTNPAPMLESYVAGRWFAAKYPQPNRVQWGTADPLV